MNATTSQKETLLELYKAKMDEVSERARSLFKLEVRTKEIHRDLADAVTILLFLQSEYEAFILRNLLALCAGSTIDATKHEQYIAKTAKMIEAIEAYTKDPEDTFKVTIECSPLLSDYYSADRLKFRRKQYAEFRKESHGDSVSEYAKLFDGFYSREGEILESVRFVKAV